MTDELTITSNIRIKYVNSSRDSVNLYPYRLSEDDKRIVTSILDGAEMAMFEEVMKANDIVCPMLVIAGLRSLLESLINRKCLKENIEIYLINSEGRRYKIPLKERFLKIEKLITDEKNKSLVYNIITIANKSIHELKNIIGRKGTKNYINNFINMLKTEIIFKNLNINNRLI